MEEDDIEQKFETYILVNPKMVSHSEEIICAETGEGCLSVNRETDGYVKRYARVTMSGFDINGSAITIRAREELAIAFQHELDHLNGILFIDFKEVKQEMRFIKKESNYRGKINIRKFIEGIISRID